VPPLNKSGGALWSLIDKDLESGLRPDKFDRPDKSGGLSGVWSSASGVWWIHWTSPVKRRNGKFGEVNTSTFPQTFLMRPSLYYGFHMTQIKYKIFDL
jgi:hypothetical protein